MSFFTMRKGAARKQLLVIVGRKGENKLHARDVSGLQLITKCIITDETEVCRVSESLRWISLKVLDKCMLRTVATWRGGDVYNCTD